LSFFYFSIPSCPHFHSPSFPSFSSYFSATFLFVLSFFSFSPYIIFPSFSHSSSVALSLRLLILLNLIFTPVLDPHSCALSVPGGELAYRCPQRPDSLWGCP
jgi:hypothetical protein